MDNKGITGADSMRIGGMTLGQLPIGEAARTIEQLPAFLKSDKENKINAIKARYPTQTVAWIDGAIKEAEQTMKHVRNLIGEQQVMISEYNGHVSLCKHRDKELAKLDETLHKTEIKALKKQFPLYNVEAMQQQIVQCDEAIVRSNGVIDSEHKSISDLRQLRVKCENRDLELRTVT